MTRSRKSTARTQRSVSVEFEDTEVVVFNAQGGQLKVTKNSKCNWKSLEAQSDMTCLVFLVDGPVGAGSSPGQNKSSGSGVKHWCQTTELIPQSSMWGWGVRARDDNKLLILSVCRARGFGPGRRTHYGLGRNWSLLLGPCRVWSARGTIYI